MLAVWKRAHAARIEVLSMTAAVELRSLTSPIEVMSESVTVAGQHSPRGKIERRVAPLQLSSAVVSSLRIRPILSISLVTPDPTKTAQTWIAEATTSGYESAAKAGVKAAAIGAWYCSRSGASSKSISCDAPKFCGPEGSLSQEERTSPHTSRRGNSRR